MGAITKLYAYSVIILIVMLSSIQAAQTDTSGPWVWDKPVSVEVKAAMLRCGPNYHFRTLFDGTFQVSKDEGNHWERLRV